MAVKFLNGFEAKKHISEGSLTVVNVFAEWCGPCKMFSPILDDLSSKENVIKVDLDQDREFAEELDVQGVPTTILFKSGKEVDRIVGYVPAELLSAKIESL